MDIVQPINRPQKGVFLAKKIFKFEKMNKAHILWLGAAKCKKHNMTYLTHPACYFQDLEDGVIATLPEFEERVGFLDIEASNLKATFGYMFSYCIKKLDGDTIVRRIKQSDILKEAQWLDRDLCVQFCKDARKFDRLIVYWGKDWRYDVPFIRTRTMFWKQKAIEDGDLEMVEKLNFPEYLELYVEDLYDIVKKKFRLHNNRLATFCQFMKITAKGHPLNPEKWNRALAGFADALDYIVTHNIEDVESTEEAWKMCKKFTNRPKTSI